MQNVQTNKVSDKNIAVINSLQIALFTKFNLQAAMRVIEEINNTNNLICKKSMSGKRL